MISFSKLGETGRLGNQLFQYAFLRTTARRLGVKFYCSDWAGNRIFTLKDENERAEVAKGISRSYVEPEQCFQFNETAMEIEDGTEIQGYFQSTRYFNKKEVLEWFSFKGDRIKCVKEKYRHVNFKNSVSLHLRLGDMRYSLPHFCCSSDYYKRALRSILGGKKILVFSDEIPEAKKWIKSVPGDLFFMDGNMPFEDLYLMSLCCDNICSASTLSWWGAFLNAHTNKIVVCPKEGGTRPGFLKTSDSCWREDGWIPIRALSPWFWNDYRFLRKFQYLRNFLQKIVHAVFLKWQRL